MSILQKSSFNERIPTGETCVISSGQQVSTAIFLNGGSLLSFQTPASWTANDSYLQGSIDGTYYTDIADENNNTLQWVTVASKGYQVHPTITSGYRYVRLVSGVAQAADRTIILGIRQVV